MDTVTLDDKVYVKATKAASLVGYTSDYIGQLCRKGTLEAKMIGNTWYVQEGSLLAHKDSNSRTNIGMTRRDIEKQRRILNTEHTVSPTRPEYPKYPRYAIDTAIRYSKDTDELLPSVGAEIPQATTLERSLIVNDETVQNNHINNHIKAIPEHSIEEKAYDEEYNDDEDDADEEVENEVREPTSRTVITYRSLLPIVCGLAFLFVIATVVLESTWQYTDTSPKQAHLETTYNLASLNSIISIIQKRAF